MVNHPNRSKQPKWQPIETAPRDESWVILYGDYMGEPRAVLGFWGYGEDWFDSEAASGSLTAFGWRPTHWMPLPSPPTT